MQQAQNIEEVFAGYFKQNTPARIVELGTATGEFTMIIHKLRSQKDMDFDYITFDHTLYLADVPANMVVCRCDIMSNFEMIKELIKENTLILCDNGNKIIEVQTLAPAMKEGCVIIAHDFTDSNWRSHEISMDDIKDVVNGCKLKPYFQDVMREGGWMSLKRE